MADTMKALKFALICFRLYRSHQRSVDRAGLASYRSLVAGVPDVALILGTGREAWGVSDLASDYFARRGVS